MPKLQMPMFCLTLLGTLAACEAALGPADPLPPTAQLLAAPPEAYREWWSRTEACAGRTGDFTKIQWYTVPNAATFTTDVGEKVGLWTHSSEGVRIIIAGDYAGNELVVRHEMLHALLDREGHPREYFQQRCGLTWDSWGSN